MDVDAYRALGLTHVWKAFTSQELYRLQHGLNLLLSSRVDHQAEALAQAIRAELEWRKEADGS